MKTRFISPILIALTMAVATAFGNLSLADETPVAAAANDGVLPDNIQPGTPPAQVVKLVQAGVDVSVIQTYITNCPTAFKLDADKIISLTDAGVPGDMINAMIAHDKDFLASLPTAEQPAAPGAEPAADTNTAVTTATVAPPEPVNVNYFYNTLNPYGSWVDVDGYGLCWRPTVVVYNSTWQPYCDRGHWVYTDCGWYWNSDYAWGVTFHYGRWFNSPRYGWCWWPDTVWAPSWVTWRSSTEYCGWAPLPPFTVYQPGVGFSYRGKNVSVSFGFGLATSCFTFVSASHFCEPQPRYYCVPQHQVAQIYGRTAVCNNYNWHNRTIVNNGVSVTFIGTAAHHPIQAVPIGSLVNANRHGWHGQNLRHSSHPFGTSNSNGSERRQIVNTGYHREAASHYENGNRENADRHFSSGNPAQTVNRYDNHNNHNQISATENRSSRPNQSEQRFVSGNLNSRTQPAQLTTAPANRNPVIVASPARTQAHNGWTANNNERRQTTRSYTPPATTATTRAPVITTTPVRPSRPNIVPTTVVQRTPTPQPQRSEPRQQPRSVSPQRSFTTPTMTVGQPQRSEPRQNFVQSAPRNITPAAPVVNTRTQNQNPPANNNGRFQGQMARNH